MAKSQTEKLLERCDLFDWKGPGFCGGCNKDLGKPSRRWCSDKCSKRFLKQHSWQSARKGAIKRDGGCVRCGRDGTVPEELKLWIKFMHGLYRRHPDRWAFREWCRQRIQENPDRWRYVTWKKSERIKRREFREETGLELEEWNHEFEKLAHRAVLNYSLEVNHIKPVKGKQATYGCLHHLDGLETLCGECHLEETRRQREEGLLG